MVCFQAETEMKGRKNGKNLIEIGRFDPSSKMCSRRGSIKRDLNLSDRVYHCEVCGLVIDRGLNAAINMRMGLIEVGLVRSELTPADRHFGPARATHRGMRSLKREAPAQKDRVVHGKVYMAVRRDVTGCWLRCCQKTSSF